MIPSINLANIRCISYGYSQYIYLGLDILNDYANMPTSILYPELHIYFIGTGSMQKFPLHSVA